MPKSNPKLICNRGGSAGPRWTRWAARAAPRPPPPPPSASPSRPRCAGQTPPPGCAWRGRARRRGAGTRAAWRPSVARATPGSCAPASPPRNPAPPRPPRARTPPPATPVATGFDANRETEHEHFAHQRIARNARGGERLGTYRVSI
eukprot:1196285-Prorocentrum_minimum.AAC.3